MTKRSTIALAVVAVALLAYIVAYERHTLGAGELEGRDNRVAREYVRARVDRIRIDRPGEPTIALLRVREDEEALGSWQMEAPIETGADDDAIGALLGSIDWADARRRIESLSPEDREAFGLAEPRVTGTFVMGNEELVIAVGAETPGGDGVYVTTDGGETAVIAGKDLFEALDHGVDHFRSKRLLERGMLTATELFIGEGDEAVRLRLEGGRWHTEEGIRAAGPRLDEALQALSDIEARRYFDEGSIEGGLTVRAVRLAGQDEGEGDVVVELTLGGPCEGDPDQRYAQVEVTKGGETEAGPLACVAARDIEPLLIPPGEWRELRPLTLSDLELESMTVEGRAGTLEVTQEDGRWIYAMGDQSGAVDDEALAEWLSAMKANRARSFIVPASEDDLRSHGLNAPVVTVTLRGTEDRSETVALGSVTSEGAYLRRDDEPAILVVPSSAATDFEASAARLRPRQILELSADDITALAFRRGTATERLEREGESWTITEPVSMSADSAEARAVARELARLEAVRFVADEVEPEHGLGTPRVDLSFTVSEDGEPRERRLRIGRSTEEGAYARLDDDSAVFLLEPDLVERLAGPLVPRDLLATSRYELARVSLSEGGRTLAIRNDQGEWITDEGPYDTEAMDDFLETLDHLRAAGASAYGPASAADGFAPPRATIHIEREEGGPDPREYDILIGAPTGEGDTVHVRRADLDVGLLLREPTVESLLAPLH